MTYQTFTGSAAARRRYWARGDTYATVTLDAPLGQALTALVAGL
jgi:hypothetical protein